MDKNIKKTIERHIGVALFCLPLSMPVGGIIGAIFLALNSGDPFPRMRPEDIIFMPIGMALYLGWWAFATTFSFGFPIKGFPPQGTHNFWPYIIPCYIVIHFLFYRLITRETKSRKEQ